MRRVAAQSEAAVRGTAAALRHVRRYAAGSLVAPAVGGACPHRGGTRLPCRADVARRLPRSLGAARLPGDHDPGRCDPQRHGGLGSGDRQFVFPAVEAAAPGARRSRECPAGVGQAAQTLSRCPGGDLPLALVAALSQRAVRPGAALSRAEYASAQPATPQRASGNSRRGSGARRRSCLCTGRGAHPEDRRIGGIPTIHTGEKQCPKHRRPIRATSSAPSRPS
jgi:hypothetical protein